MLEIWFPRYNDQYTDKKEKVALLAKYKVDQSTPVILIKFTKAKHLDGQRFAIKRADAIKCPIDTNGKIPCYAVPMSKLDDWETNAEEIDNFSDAVINAQLHKQTLDGAEEAVKGITKSRKRGRDMLDDLDDEKWRGK